MNWIILSVDCNRTENVKIFELEFVFFGEYFKLFMLEISKNKL